MQLDSSQDKQVYRIPLVGTEFARMISTAAGATSSSGIVGVGVVGVMIIGYIPSSIKDQRLVNAIPEKIVNPFTNKETYYINKRPGFAENNIPSAGDTGTAIHVWLGKSNGTDVISAFGDTNSEIFNGVSSLGSTTGVVKYINETLIGTTANLLFATTSNTGYFYPNAGSLTQIVDVDFPGNISGETITGGFVQLDGFTFIMTISGKIYNSDLNSVVNWPGDFISSNMSPDTGVGLARYKDQIVAFSKSSIEFFQDIGNDTGSPLKRTDQGFINIGCVNADSIVEIDDTVAFIGTTNESTIGLYMFEGLQPKKFSTPTIESLLAQGQPGTLTLNAIHLVGKTLLLITDVSTARTYVYCVEDNMWHEWNSTSVLWEKMTGIASGIKYIYAVTSQNTNGKVYVIDPTNFTFQDDGNDYTFLVQTTKVDLGNQRRKFLSQLRLIGDIQTSSTPVGITWSDDDYQTWHDVRTVDLMDEDVNISALGSFRRRAFKITQSGNTPLRLEALELSMTQGYV